MKIKFKNKLNGEVVKVKIVPKANNKISVSDSEHNPTVLNYDNKLSFCLAPDVLPVLQKYQTEIKRFDSTYWRVDGPPTASFSLTNYQDGFEVSFQCRQTDDLIGIIWNSEDTKDHQYIAYETRTDYSGLLWSFDIELSDSMPVLNDPKYAPTLTVHYRDEIGRKGIAYIALWNYASDPSSRSARITLDWDTVKGGYAATTRFSVTNIDQIFFGGYVEGYDKTNVSKFDTTKEGYVRILNSQVQGSGSIIKLNRVVAPNHQIGMCTSYDDHYDLNPTRIVNNLKALGYSGFLNHYCGMSHYPVINWNHTLNRFQIPDTLVDNSEVVNTACKKWHQAFANELKIQGFEPVFSVSWELYSLGAREEWCQREYNDRLGKTGYTPPSYFASLCHKNALAYLHKAYKEFADILVNASLPVVMQIGEPWWWFNTDSLNPCVYDYETRLAFNADTGLYAPDLGTIYEAVNKTDSTSMAFKAWLRDKLGQTCIDIRTLIKDTYGSDAKVCPLIFFPSIRTHQESLATYINYPQEHYQYPNFDFVMTEAYDWVIEQPPRLDLSHQAVNEIPIGELNYPPSKVAYLSGFVPDKQIAYIYKFDYKTSYRSPIWQRIFGDIKNNESAKIMKQLAWAYPQVMYDSLTIHDKGFFIGETFTTPIQDNTPYPVDIIGTDLQPPVADPILKPVNVAAKVSDWGDIQITFDVDYDRDNISYEVHLLNESGVYSLISRNTNSHEVFFSITEREKYIGLSNSLKVFIVPSEGENSEIIDVDAVLNNNFVQKVIIFAGESNALGHFNSLSGDSKATVSATVTRNIIANKIGLHEAQVLPISVAWSNSSIDKLADDDPVLGTNYWYDLDTNTDGPRLVEALQILESVASKIHTIIWSQGENDAIAYRRTSPSLSTPERYLQATNLVLSRLLSICPSNVKIVWQILARSYYGDISPTESDGLGWKLYRDSQRSMIETNSKYILGSWVTGAERLSGYIKESNSYIHYTKEVYHLAAEDLGMSIAHNIDRISNIPAWITMDSVSNITGIRQGEDIVISWTENNLKTYKFSQVNVLDGTILYSRILNTNSDIFTAEDQREAYGFLASVIICKISVLDLENDIESYVITETINIS